MSSVFVEEILINRMQGLVAIYGAEQVVKHLAHVCRDRAEIAVHSRPESIEAQCWQEASDRLHAIAVGPIADAESLAKEAS